jgi:hypothetical protein
MDLVEEKVLRLENYKFSCIVTIYFKYCHTISSARNNTKDIKVFFLNLALESRLRTHHSCKSVRFKQLIRDPLSV